MFKFFRSFLGGHPITLNDLNFIQNGVQELFLKFHTFLTANEPLARTQGINIVGTVSSCGWGEGVLYANGNFYLVEEQSTPVNLNTHSFELLEIAEPDNPVEYGNGSFQDVHITRFANLIPNNTGQLSGVNFFNAPRSIEKTAETLINNGGIIPKIESNGWNNLTIDVDFTELKPLKYKRINNTLKFSGTIEGVVTSFDTILLSGILPEDRPLVNDAMFVDYLEPSGLGQVAQRVHVRIKTTGEIEFISSNYPQLSGGWRVYFDNSNYYL